MYTKEELMNANHIYKPVLTKGVLTSEEALERALHTGNLNIHTSSEARIFYFTDDHCFGYPVRPSHIVACSVKFPKEVEERPGVEDGIVNTIEKYILVFGDGYHQITSIEELVDHLNQWVA